MSTPGPRLAVLCLFLALLAGAGCAPAPRPGAALAHAPDRSLDSSAVDRVLDDFHAAAADADGDRYFGHLAEDAVFIGTDASERWTREAFANFARPYFARGTGWTYVPRERHLAFSADGGTAWFDEILDNEKYGTCRGTGVLVRRGGTWRISQYALTIPIPNAIAGEVVEMIEAVNAPDGGGLVPIPRPQERR